MSFSPVAPQSSKATGLCSFHSLFRFGFAFSFFVLFLVSSAVESVLFFFFTNARWGVAGKEVFWRGGERLRRSRR